MVASVGVYDWLLALHLLAAFAMASGLVLFSAMVIAGRRLDSLEGARTLFRVAPSGGPLGGAGSVLALLLGIAMAIDSDRYQLWDGWVIAALVLWAALGGVGGRTGKYYTAIERPTTPQRSSTCAIASAGTSRRCRRKPALTAIASGSSRLVP
jgi:hypothetical protein